MLRSVDRLQTEPARWQTPSVPHRVLGTGDTCRDPALPSPSFVAAFPAVSSFRRLRRPYNATKRPLCNSWHPGNWFQEFDPTHDLCRLLFQILLSSEDGYELRRTPSRYKSAPQNANVGWQELVAPFGNARSNEDMGEGIIAQRSQHRPPPSEQPSWHDSRFSVHSAGGGASSALFVKGRTGPRRLGESNPTIARLRRWSTRTVVSSTITARRPEQEGCRSGTRKLGAPLVLGPMRRLSINRTSLKHHRGEFAASKTESALQFAFRRSELMAPAAADHTVLHAFYCQPKIGKDVRLALVTC